MRGISKGTFISGVALAAAMGLSGVTHGVTTIGGIDFDDDAFADTLISSAGSFTTAGGSLATVLTDKSAGSYAFSFDRVAYAELGFTDNVVTNGPGADLAIFSAADARAVQVRATTGVAASGPSCTESNASDTRVSEI